MRMQSVMLTGLFRHKQGDTLWCLDDTGGDFDVAKELTTLVNQEIMLAMHHLPSDPLDLSKWGGGCCTWQETGICPAGHHEHPDKLLVFSATGVLIQRGDDWAIRSEQSVTVLPLEMLPGHRARLVAMTVFKPEVGTSDEDLRTSIEQMRNLISRLSNLPKAE